MKTAHERVRWRGTLEDTRGGGGGLGPDLRGQTSTPGERPSHAGSWAEAHTRPVSAHASLGVQERREPRSRAPPAPGGTARSAFLPGIPRRGWRLEVRMRVRPPRGDAERSPNLRAPLPSRSGRALGKRLRRAGPPEQRERRPERRRACPAAAAADDAPEPTAHLRLGARRRRRLGTSSRARRPEGLSGVCFREGAAAGPAGKMPVAVMADSAFSFKKLLDQCENQELEAPGGIATPPVYGQLLALYLLHNDICHTEKSLRPGLSSLHLHHRRRLCSLCGAPGGRGRESCRGPGCFLQPVYSPIRARPSPAHPQRAAVGQTDRLRGFPRKLTCHSEFKIHLQNPVY
uniref:COP9 signalosome subunit 8 n=1 Tax=Felis catus TaxID=9685 RepID=A0ABI7WXL8_FELCA